MSYAQVPQNDQVTNDSDLEDNAREATTSSGDDTDDSSLPSLRRVRWIAAGVAFTVMAVVAPLTIVRASSRAAEALDAAPPHSARALLESPEMNAVATRNLLKVLPQLARSQDKLRSHLAGGMKNLTKLLKVQEPKVYEQLNELVLTREQEESVLSAVHRMSDPRLQPLGQEVARIAHESRTSGAESFKRRLEEKFEADRLTLRQLRNDVLPASLHARMDKDSDMSFNADHMRLVRDYPQAVDLEARQLLSTESSGTSADTSSGTSSGTSADTSSGTSSGTSAGTSGTSSTGDISSSGDIGGMVDPDNYDEYATNFEQGLGLFSGLIEQARVALDQIDFVGESFDVDMKIPYWAKSFIGGLDFVTEMSDCVMRAGVGTGENGDSNGAKLMMCPMKYASAATDFLEGIDNVLGMSNGHFFGPPSTTLYPGQNLVGAPQQGVQQSQPPSNGAHGYDAWAG